MFGPMTLKFEIIKREIVVKTVVTDMKEKYDTYKANNSCIGAEHQPGRGSTMTCNYFPGAIFFAAIGIRLPVALSRSVINNIL